MKSNYKQLGQFIRQVDIRNSEGKEEIYLVFLFKRIYSIYCKYSWNGF